MNQSRRTTFARSRRFAAVSALAVAALAGASHAQTAPSNDMCQQAIDLGIVRSHTDFITEVGSTHNATLDGVAPCVPGISPDVWYTFTSRYAGPITIDTCGSAFDTALTVYSGCPQSGGRVLACNDDASAVGDCGVTPTSSVTINASNGVTYWIRIAGHPRETGAYTLRIAPGQGIATTVSNDVCAEAQPVEYGEHPFTILGARSSAPAWNPAGDCTGRMQNDVWFSFRACSTGEVTASTCVGTFWDSMIEVYRGSCASSARIVCNDDACGLQASATFQAINGQTYYIRVGAGPDATYKNNGVLAIWGSPCVPPPPPNDACSRSISLSNGDGLAQAVGTTVSATSDGAASCGASHNSPDVWYSYTATQSSPVILDTCGANFDTVLSVHTGCPGSISNLVACNDNATVGSCAGTPTSSLTFNAVSGTTYKIRVAGKGRATGSFILLARRGTSFPISSGPANNACYNAKRVGYGSYRYSIVNATTDGPSATSVGDCVGTIANDVWFAFQACSNGTVTVSTVPNEAVYDFGIGYDTKVGVYTGTCGALNLLACNNNGRGTLSSVSFEAVMGRVYYIRAGLDPAYRCEGDGSLTIYGPPCVLRSNDSFTTPQSMSALTTVRTASGDTRGATTDGVATCGGGLRDVWHLLRCVNPGPVTLSTCGADFDTVLSVYSSDARFIFGCNDNATSGVCEGTTASSLTFTAAANTTYLIRVAGNNNATGRFVLRAAYGNGLVEGPEFCPCDWNIDHSVDSSDFFAFLTDFMAGDADFNNSGEVDSRDLFDFIECFLNRSGLCAN